jgi:two-component system, NtrC family, sensor histidine kinase HydH
LLALGFVGTLAVRTNDTLEQAEQAQTDKAWMLANSVASTLRGVARYGPDTNERIEAIFHEIVRSPSVKSIALGNDSSQWLFLEGDPPPVDLEWVEHPSGRFVQTPESLFVIVPLEIRSSHGMGRGRGSERQVSRLPSGSYRVLLALDVGPTSSVRSHVVTNSIVLLLILMLLATIAGILAWSLGQNEALRREMALEAQRLKSSESLRMLAAGLAHETKNPLGAIRGYTQLLHEGSSNEEVVSQTGLILDQIDHMTERIEEFLAFARTRRPRRESVDLSALARGVVDLLVADACAADVDISCAGAEEARLEGDRSQLQELLMNLVINAIQACDSGDGVQVAIHSAQHHVLLEVIDTGRGIPQDQLSKVTEPYFTTRQEGSGLGLAIAERIAESHHAMLQIESTWGEGTRVAVQLPKEMAGE